MDDHEAYDPWLVRSAIDIAVLAGWTMVPDDLADRLANWSSRSRAYKTQPYVDLDSLIEQNMLVPYGTRARQYRREALVAMLRRAQLLGEAQGALLGVIAPGGEHRARRRDRRALGSGELSQEEFDRRWGGINIEG